jgi:hypothetical protein
MAVSSRPSTNVKNKLLAGLFSFERILDAADGILNLLLDFVSVDFRLQLGVADHLLGCAPHLLPGPTTRSS